MEIESNKGLEIEEERMKTNLKKLHVLKIKWKLHVRNALYWAFFCVNDKKEID